MGSPFFINNSKNRAEKSLHGVTKILKEWGHHFRGTIFSNNWSLSTKIIIIIGVNISFTTIISICGVNKNMDNLVWVTVLLLKIRNNWPFLTNLQGFIQKIMILKKNSPISSNNCVFLQLLCSN